MKDGSVWEQAHAKEIHDMLSSAGERAGGAVSFGIRALELSAQGYWQPGSGVDYGSEARHGAHVDD